MQSTRTFVALVIPDSLGAKLTRLQSLLAPSVERVRWATASPFHVTLAFLGDVNNADLNAVCLAVQDAARDTPPLELRIEGLNLFGTPTRPRVLWVGLGGPGLDALLALQKRIAAAAADAGYPDDEPVYRPHVTLGRVTRGRAPGADLTPLLNHYRTWSAGSFRAAEAVTFASTLTPDGPVYAPLARAPLAAGKGESPA
jgi:2'-5' RNA ligase